MARALNKVQKHISKKRGGKPTALHENSRDAQRLRTAGAREDKLAKIMNHAIRANQHYVDRVAWFRDQALENGQPLSDDRLHELTKAFIGRENEELEELNAQQRPGRPRSKAQDQILSRIDGENKEFNSGFWLPECRTREDVDMLEKWSGQWAGLGTLKFIRVVQNGEIKTSSFPPKGLS